VDPDDRPRRAAGQIRGSLNTAGSSWVPIPPSSRKPTGEANRCNLRHVAPKTLQKALYVGFSQIGQPLQVVGFGWSQFPIPEARLAGQAGPIYPNAEVEKPRNTPNTRKAGLDNRQPARRIWCRPWSGCSQTLWCISCVSWFLLRGSGSTVWRLADRLLLIRVCPAYANSLRPM
jgi:hypothetical protein